MAILFINGEKQSEEITKKYKPYLDSKKNVNIRLMFKINLQRLIFATEY